LLEGKDILGIAQTGTGKTAAFALPILHNLVNSGNTVKSGGVRTLILTPTRELASQIAENIELYGKDLHLRHAVIFGGVSERPQIATLQRGVDILISTPGRLLDLASQGYIRFMNLEILVLDEADRMLDMGFINDIKKIIARLPEKRQTLFFSATMPSSIADLANSILKNPVKIEITPESTTVERIDQKINFVAKGNKLSLLKRILKQEDAASVLAFSKTKHGANRIQEFLEKNGISVAAIHGNKSQGAREKALASFRDAKVQVLIATDIAARGIDVPSISHVINFDIPMDPESYVHRIGRTARAGKEGVAISFCDPSERKLLQAVEKTIRFKIPVDETHAYHGVEAAPSSHEDHDRPRSPRPSSRRPASNSSRGSSERRSSPSSSSDRRSAPSSDRRGAPSSDRRSSASSDRRSSAPRGRDDRRPNGSEQPDGRKSGLLDFIGFGKKSPTLTSGDRGGRPSPTRSDDAYRVPGVVEDKGGFGFGWLKSGAKKSDSRGGFGGRERSPSRERSASGPRDDSFGNRERPAREGSSRGGFGGGERSSGSRGGFGGGERSGASRGGFGGGERSSGSRGGERSSGARSGGFGSSERSSGSRSSGGFGERSSSRSDSFGNSERSNRTPARDGSSFGARRTSDDRKPFNRSSGAGRPAPRKTW
jgi:ATP-dependent RNA helicase RhlE